MSTKEADIPILGVGDAKFGKHYFECDYGCAVVQVSTMEWDEYTTEVILTVYGQYDREWKERLRHIWEIIRYGHPWGATEICLRGEEAIRFGQILVENGRAALKSDD